MTEAEFKKRTKQFALRIVNVVDALPSSKLGRLIEEQLLRAGTSVASNYRASCRARSTADMIAKLSIVEEEADESIFWLEFIIDADMMPKERLIPLIDEANQIEAMIVASIKTLRQSNRGTI